MNMTNEYIAVTKSSWAEAEVARCKIIRGNTATSRLFNRDIMCILNCMLMFDEARVRSSIGR